jgi:SAM-dependent methyltransferase
VTENPSRGAISEEHGFWDEAKNTRILAWAAEEGAVPFGVDVSGPIVAQARHAFHGVSLGAAVADLRWLPFPDGVFDAIYSMGTIEHLRDPERALLEMTRVLRPGGTAIIGVPNRHDPFGRPPLAAAVLTAALLRPFELLDRNFPSVRRHGYLVVAVARKPTATPTRRS